MEENDQIDYSSNMNFFEKIIHSLQKTMECPTNYGWFHIMFLIIIIVGTFIICKFFKNCSEKTVNILLFIFWAVVFLLEVYKQLEFSFTYSDEVAKWDYQFYAFPFQFCSSQLYILPFIFLLKDSKIRDGMILFTITFLFFGGLAVCIYPNNVFVETIGINIQTMIHHGTQLLLGIFLFIRYGEKLNLMNYLRGVVVFLCLLFIALSLNIIVYKMLQSIGNDEKFNMFYISPYFECQLPILSIIQSKTPYLVFLLIYMFGFVFIAFILYVVELKIYKLIDKNKYEKEKV